MVRTVAFAKLAPLALVLALTACGGADDFEGSTAPSQSPTGSASAPKSGETQKVTTEMRTAKGCNNIIKSGAIETIIELFDHYKKDPSAAGAMNVSAMRKALDDLAKAGDNAPDKIRAAAVALVSDVGSLLDSYSHLEGISTVASVGQIQREIDALCVPKN
ncbi:MAG: hypothetical protein ABIR57_10305 [Aeromicrobium sp.]